MASDLMKAMFGKTGKAPDKPADQVADQVTEETQRLLSAVHGAMTGRELLAALRLRGRVNFRQKYLTPALTAGLIAMTIPDKPQSRLQKYRLTEKGRASLRKAKQEAISPLRTTPTEDAFPSVPSRNRLGQPVSGPVSAVSGVMSGQPILLKNPSAW